MGDRLAAIGTWTRTLAGLRPLQIAAQGSYRLRRELIPSVARLIDYIGEPASPSTLPLDVLTGCPALTVQEPAAIAALEADRLMLAGQDLPLPSHHNDYATEGDALYAYQLHELGWLRQALADPQTCSSLEKKLLSWLARYLAHDHRRTSVYWSPHPLGGRVFNLVALRARLGARPGMLALIERDLQRSTLALAGLAETHLLANHLLRNRTALVVGAAFVPGRAGRLLLRHAQHQLQGLLAHQFLSDGTHEERSPGYHLLSTIELVAVSRILDALELRDPSLDACIQRALGAAIVFRDGDGLISAYGDSAPHSVPAVNELLAWAKAHQLEPLAPPAQTSGAWTRQTLPTAGFSRLRRAGLQLLVNHGPFGAPNQAGHAHCDLFSFELCLGERRMIVDPGVHSYHDPQLRMSSRSSSSHCTPAREGIEQAEIWKSFRVGWKPKLGDIDWQQLTDGWELRADAVAFGPSDPKQIRRRIRFEGDQITVHDHIEGLNDFSVALPLHPEVQLEAAAAGATQCWLLRRGEHSVTLRVSRGSGVVEQGMVSHRFGEPMLAPVVRLHAEDGVLEFCLECSQSDTL